MSVSHSLKREKARARRDDGAWPVRRYCSNPLANRSCCAFVIGALCSAPSQSRTTFKSLLILSGQSSRLLSAIIRSNQTWAISCMNVEAFAALRSFIMVGPVPMPVLGKVTRPWRFCSNVSDLSDWGGGKSRFKFGISDLGTVSPLGAAAASAAISFDPSESKRSTTDFWAFASCSSPPFVNGLPSSSFMLGMLFLAVSTSHLFMSACDRYALVDMDSSRNLTAADPAPSKV